MKTEEELWRFYKESASYREMLAREDAPRKFAPYLSLVKSGVERGATGLDIGCGTGTSSGVLVRAGYRMVGMDISPLFRKDLNLNFIRGNSFFLPFKESSFDFVGMNAVIEHIPDVERLLDEVTRVLKKGGHLVIYSPNLLSPLKLAKALLAAMGMKIPHRHYGTGWGALGNIFANVFKVLGKEFSPGYRFSYVTPRLHEFSGPDDDAVYLSNGVDLERYLKRRGFTVEKRQPPSLTFPIRLLLALMGPFGPNVGIIAKRR